MHDSPNRPAQPLNVFVGITAFLALVVATVAIVVAGFGDDDSPGVAAGSSAAAPVQVSLTEFAITPSTTTVATGGQLDVVNDGSAVHNLTVRGTDISTADLGAGGSEVLDLSALDAGSYEVFCSIPGHESAGMVADLVISDSGAASGESAHGGREMTAADYERMDQAMMDSILAYPAETEGVGNEVLEPTVLADGTKQFELTAAITPWEVEPGKVVDAWSYNGIVPGPAMHVDRGDKVQIVLSNELPMSTDLHLHGVVLPNSMDGVAPITQDLVAPGESFTYEFVAERVSVAMYHAHHHAQLQVPNGMFGTFYIGQVPIPAGRTIGGQAVPGDVTIAQEVPMVLNDAGVIGYSLNGKGFPATEPIVGELGDWILVHYFNEGTQIHPMHMHQFDQIVIAKDGYPLDSPYVTDTLNVAPGERYSVLVELESPGTWVWHCHILPHVEQETGMFGMVTAVVVQ